MNSNKKVKLIGTILGIIIFISLIVGLSYAWFTWRSSNVNISGNTECFDVHYTNGQDIVNASTILFDESTIINNNKITIKDGMALTDVTAYVNSGCNIFANLEIILNVTDLNSAFIDGDSVGAFKYVLTRYDPSVYSDITTTALNGQSFDIIKTGSITSTGEMTLVDEALATTEQGYLIIFYIDGDLAMNDAQYSTFSATITGIATQYEPITLIEHITNLYTSGTPTLITQETSGDSYYYSFQDTDETWGLMNDGLKIDNTLDATTTSLAVTVTDTAKLTNGTEGNIRYFGPSASVNNYIYFNCSNYSTQSDSTCEKWRIIGIVDGKVKIIKEESIGKLAWDQDKNQNSSLTTYNNNWTTSSLQEFLNGLYYNRGTKDEHTYLSGDDGTTSTTLYLSNIGITEATRNNNLIYESTWYLGGYSTSEGLYPNDIYNYERTNDIGTTIYSTNDFIINKNIGLMYPSDYGYGTDLTKCSKNIYNYNSVSACKTNNWLFNSADQWLITPRSSNSYSAWGVYSTGNVYFDGSVYTAYYGVRPVLYLNSELGMESEGDGSIDNPYRISV